MSRAGERLIEGAKEALAIAKGEQPAARIHINGHTYVPESAVREAILAAEKRGAERERELAAQDFFNLHNNLMSAIDPATPNREAEDFYRIAKLAGEYGDSRSIASTIRGTE